jgi:SanA protein
MKRKIAIIFLTFLILTTVVAIILCDKIITNDSRGKLYTEINSIPFNKVGLLLGTSKYLKGGGLNPYYVFRIEATAKLIKGVKIKYVIISGDNGTKKYNEPQMMRTDLIKSGIDSTCIFLDYAGFRTFDSMVRLQEIFSQKSVTVISQQFHNERAIYIANRLGISAIGFNATDLTNSLGFKVQFREKFARVKVFLDFIFGNHPKYLGRRIAIPN